MQSPRALIERYNRLRHTPSDIHEHLDTLRKLATQTPKILELGVRHAVSTTAFLHGLFSVQSKLEPHLYGMDLDEKLDVCELQKVVDGTSVQFTFFNHNTANPPDGLLLPDQFGGVFIDTWHVEEQLAAELSWAGSRIEPGGWLALHDTETFWERGESPGHRGLKFALEAWLESEGRVSIERLDGTMENVAKWSIGWKSRNNNGLTILWRNLYAH